MVDNQLSLRQKAQKINLSGKFYGTFAEIGAGQEVARHFFQAGGASGSIAKTISAYDMIFSDHIYGKETSGRYVCESRLIKMLEKEYALLEERLSDTKGKDHQFFAFSNTVSALNFKRTNEAHGWLGVRFQSKPGAPSSEVLIHLRMLDPQNLLQQDCLGIIGVNLMYACFYLHETPELFIRSLLDHLDTTRLEINVIKFNGEAFKHIDNRLMNLQLVKEGFTHAIMFNEKGEVVLTQDEVYKKDVLIVRGSYRPPTLVNMDMIKAGLKNFSQKINVPEKDIVPISEITISTQEGGFTNEDFLARVELMTTLGMRVLVSNYPQYYRLSSYFAKYTNRNIGLVLGVYNFKQVFDEEYSNLEGGLLAALGQLFRKNVYVYVYPYKSEDQKEFTTLESLKVPDASKPLFEYLKASQQVVGIHNFREDVLHIYSRKVLNMIVNNEPGWEKMVPESVAKTINEKCLFGHPCFRSKT
jgi:hypothetical protein